MDSNPYPDSMARLMQLVKDLYGTNGAIIKQYYEGDPVVIPKANLPCIIIEKAKGNLTSKGASTMHDNLGEKITIRICMDKKDDFGQSDDYDLTERRLRQLIEERDPITKQYKPNTLLYALRTNLTLGSTVIENDIDMDYDLNPRPNMEVTSEGIITIVTREKVYIPNRQ